MQELGIGPPDSSIYNTKLDNEIGQFIALLREKKYLMNPYTEGPHISMSGLLLDDELVHYVTQCRQNRNIFWEWIRESSNFGKSHKLTPLFILAQHRTDYNKLEKKTKAEIAEIVSLKLQQLRGLGQNEEADVLESEFEEQIKPGTKSLYISFILKVDELINTTQSMKESATYEDGISETTSRDYLLIDLYICGFVWGGETGVTWRGKIDYLWQLACGGLWINVCGYGWSWHRRIGWRLQYVWKMEKETVPAFMDFRARQNKTRAQIIDIYDKEAEIYDETIKEIEFFVYEDIGEKVADFYSQNKESVRILDICEGTGLVGVELSKRGFKNVDWLDPSEGMKKEALKKNVYTNYYLEFLDGHQIEAIKTDMYDCVTMSGGLNVGLVPCIGLLEMVRVTKPGGLVCFAALTSRNNAVEEYRNRLEPLMEWLEQDGIWSLLDKGTISKYSKGSGPGVLYSFVVKANDVDVAKYEDKLQYQKKE